MKQYSKKTYRGITDSITDIQTLKICVKLCIKVTQPKQSPYLVIIPKISVISSSVSIYKKSR
jgi:hypothetical protein